MVVNVCMENCTNFGGYMDDVISVESWTSLNKALDSLEYQPWVFSLIGSALVGLAGIFPLLIIHIEEGNNAKSNASSATLQLLLSFAVGGLLGDVFLHLLPEAWTNSAFQRADGDRPPTICGLWVLGGFLVFVIVEKIFAFEEESETVDMGTPTIREQSISSSFSKNHLETENNNCLTMIGKNSNGVKGVNGSRDFSNEDLNIHPFLQKSSLKNGYTEKMDHHNNIERKNSEKCKISAKDMKVYPPSSMEMKNFTKYACVNNQRGITNGSHILTETITKISIKAKSIHVTGYLNLMANCIDNFTHGLAVGGSFLVSFRLGALTTFAILVHEIPHEVGDFAILLRSGFNRWDAAKAQLVTACGGVFGALTAVWCSGGGIKAQTSWILPFTAGGFLHIGMVTILPELLKESSPKESFKQLGALCFGIALMAILTVLCD